MIYNGLGIICINKRIYRYPNHDLDLCDNLPKELVVFLLGC